MMSHLFVLLLVLAVLQSASACSPANTPDSSGAVKYLVGRISFDVSIPGTDLSSRTTALFPIKWLPQDGPTPKSIQQFLQFLPSEYQTLLGSLNFDVPTRSFEGASPDTSLGTFPLAQFMHGDSSTHIISMDTLEHIAARGFVVLASDAPCNSLELAFGAAPPGCDSTPAGVSLHKVAKLVRERLFARTGEFASSGIASSVPAVTHGAQSVCSGSGNYSLFGHSRGGIYAFCEGSKSDADPNLKFVAELCIDAIRWPGDASCVQESGVYPFQSSFLQVFAGNDSFTPSAAAQLDQLRNNIAVPAGNFKASFGIEQAGHPAPVLPAICGFLAANPLIGILQGQLPRQFNDLLAECARRGDAGVAADSTAMNSILAASFVAVFSSDATCANQYLTSGAAAGPAATGGLVSHVELPSGAQSSASRCNDRLFEEFPKLAGSPEPVTAGDDETSAAALKGLPSWATGSIIAIATVALSSRRAS